MNIAIIGAGMSGLVCARALQQQGHQVTLYEKSAAVSGRMSTRHTELGGFDHGAQYLTASSAAFDRATADWAEAGWLAPWHGNLVTLEKGCATPVAQSKAKKTRYVGVPGMRSIGEQLARGLDVRLGQRVEAVEKFGHQWLLAVQADTVPVTASAGPFDAVVVTAPADQAVSLLQADGAFAAAALHAKLVPCWSLLLAFQDTLGLDYDGAWVSGSRLGWLALDASKPGRRPGEHWIAQATAAWSVEHLEDEPERAKEKLLKAFHEATGKHVQPVYAAVHRWRYSQAAQPLAEDCLWNPHSRLGACGDWFRVGLEGAGRIENAYLSGLALAAKIG